MDAHNRLSPQAIHGKLTARPLHDPANPVHAPTGYQRLGLSPDSRRDGALYVPAGVHPDRPAPLVVTLHGAGGTAAGAVEHLRGVAEQAGVVLLAPESRSTTWDMLRGGLGPDVAFIDAALQQVFQRYCIDDSHVCCSGFSDGASYALTLGLTNGDLFTHIAAYSPGFMQPGQPAGRPKVYVSHGVYDAVLSIDHCSRRLVPKLRAGGYDVQYTEFQGPHTVPDAVARESFAWFLGGSKGQQGGVTGSQRREQ